jgi:hypothetical protein
MDKITFSSIYSKVHIYANKDFKNLIVAYSKSESDTSSLSADVIRRLGEGLKLTKGLSIKLHHYINNNVGEDNVLPYKFVSQMELLKIKIQALYSWPFVQNTIDDLIEVYTKKGYRTTSEIDPVNGEVCEDVFSKSGVFVLRLRHTGNYTYILEQIFGPILQILNLHLKNTGRVPMSKVGSKSSVSELVQQITSTNRLELNRKPLRLHSRIGLNRLKQRIGECYDILTRGPKPFIVDTSASTFYQVLSGTPPPGAHIYWNGAVWELHDFLQGIGNLLASKTHRWRRASFYFKRPQGSLKPAFTNEAIKNPKVAKRNPLRVELLKGALHALNRE